MKSNEGMFQEWKDGVTVYAGPFTNGQITGKIFSADFSMNRIHIDCGNGLSWSGTSQEFDRYWKPVRMKGNK